MKELVQKLGQAVIPYLLYMLIRFIWFTTFKKFHFITDIGDEQHICVCWHGELCISPQAYRTIHKKQSASAIISTHSDGSLLASTLNLLNIKPLRGSTRKGGTQALFQAFRRIKDGDEVLITPDGPKGPRHSMSDGATGLALKSKLPVFIVNYTSKKYWQFKSWDKFVIPKPFSRVDIYMQSISLEGMELHEAREYLLKKMLEHTIL